MKARVPRSQPASKRAVESTTRSLEALRGRWAPRDRFRSDAIPLFQAALAAGLAWFVARGPVGHTAPIFAPIGALLILSNAPGRRTSRVLAATLGAVIGIAVGDLLVSAIGTGAIQVAVVALFAMSATAVLGASPAVVTNAGIAAVLIATVQPAHGFYSPAAAQRLVDVLIGGATSLAVLVLLPAHSLSSTRRAATALLVELSVTLDEVASALERRDEEAAEQALEHARGLDSFVGRLRGESDLAHEAVLLAPIDRQRRLLLDRYRAAAPKLELAVRNVRVLARAGVCAIELDPSTGEQLSYGVRQVASTVSALARTIQVGDREGTVSQELVDAAHRASAVAEGEPAWPAVRSWHRSAPRPSTSSRPEGSNTPKQSNECGSHGTEFVPVEPARRAVLFINPTSGGGKARRARLADLARERGIEPVTLARGQDVEGLIQGALASGADALGVAGGDGSLAVVAAAAAASRIPFVCIPAGTRNHFARDVGVAPNDLVGALDAFGAALERTIDLGDVNGRPFLNNVSLGIYADAVRQAGYRDAKLRTLLETAREEALGSSSTPADVHLVDDRGAEHRSPAVVLVSNNP